MFLLHRISGGGTPSQSDLLSGRRSLNPHFNLTFSEFFETRWATYMNRLSEQCIRMRRKFRDDEDIKMEATMIDGYEQSSKPADDNSGVDVLLHVSLLVDISERDGNHELEFMCSAWPYRLEVDEVYVLKAVGMLANPYTGPYFSNLNGELQKAFVEYLKVRGINDNLSLFWHEYMVNKDRAELMNWLEKLDFFLEK